MQISYWLTVTQTQKMSPKNKVIFLKLTYFLKKKFYETLKDFTIDCPFQGLK